MHKFIISSISFLFFVVKEGAKTQKKEELQYNYGGFYNAQANLRRGAIPYLQAHQHTRKGVFGLKKKIH